MDIKYWVIVGLLLIGVEVALFPGEFCLWIGLSSIISSGIFWVFGISLFTAQGFIFIAISFFALLSVKKYYKSKMPVKEQVVSNLDLKMESLIGKEFMLIRPIQNGKGRITIDGVSWILSGPDLKAGEFIKIVEFEGNIICVEPKTYELN